MADKIHACNGEWESEYTKKAYTSNIVESKKQRNVTWLT